MNKCIHNYAKKEVDFFYLTQEERHLSKLQFDTNFSALG